MSMRYASSHSDVLASFHGGSHQTFDLDDEDSLGPAIGRRRSWRPR